MEALFLITSHMKFNESDELSALQLVIDSPRQQTNLLVKRKYTLDNSVERWF